MLKLGTYPKFDPINIANCLLGETNCFTGCNKGPCNGSGEYRDYNGDFAPGCYNNIMAYDGVNCTGVAQFTNDQKDLMAWTFQDYWSSRLKSNPINCTDFVEMEGTSAPLKGVIIRWKHPNAKDYTNCMSQPAGDFQAVLYEPSVRAEVRKMGQKAIPVFPPDFKDVCSNIQQSYLV